MLERWTGAVLTALLLLVSLPGGAAAGGERAYHFVPERGTTYELARLEGAVLTVRLHAWGPEWQYFSLHDEPRVAADGSRVVESARTIRGTGVDMRLSHRVAADGAGRGGLVLEHEVVAEEEAPLTLVALALMPEGGAFARLEIERATGVRERIGLPIEGMPVEGEAVGVAYLDEDDEVQVRFTFDEPRPVTNQDDELRVEIVAERIAAREPRTLRTRLLTAEPLHFYRRAADAAQQTDTSGWFAYPVGEGGTPIDLSFLNRDEDGAFVKAGSRGFVSVVGDRLVFEDGSAARFWGVNVTAAAALGSPRRSRQLAERLARLGVNVVRLHHLDSWYRPIIDYDHPSGTTQHLDAESMRRLDRLVYELKQRGIYIILDPWVQRTFTEADGVARADELGSGNFHLHPYIFFDERMRALHKRFMKQVWSHVNEHTGLAYRDDPAFVLTAVANEALMQRGPNQVQLEPYRSDFLQRYEAWAREHGADVDAGEAVIERNWPRDHQRFYMAVMEDFYGDMHRFFREELGLRIPINASNWFRWHWEIASQAGLDVMDGHLYYEGDQVGPGGGLGGSWVAHPPHEPGTPFGRLGAVHLADKPMMVSEVGHNPPSSYRSACYPGLAAVASLQGWDAVTPYAYSQSGQPQTHLHGPHQGAYELEADPASVASLAAAALIYRHAEVQPAEQRVLFHIDDDHLFELHHNARAAEAYENTGLFNALLETHRVNVHLGDALPGDVAEGFDRVVTPDEALRKYDREVTELRSDTGQIRRDWRAGVGTVDTPRTQAAYGRVADQELLSTADVQFAIETPFAVVTLSSLNEQPIRGSDRLVLIAVARAENSGMSYDLTGRRVRELGGPPMLAEPVVGEVTVATDREHLRLYPVRANGTRRDGVDVPVRDGRATLELRADHQTLFYEIEAVDGDEPGV